MGQPSTVLLLDCSASTMTRRLQQRVLSSLRRTDSCHREARLRVEGFCGTLTPLATHYETLGLLHKVSVANNNLDQLQPRTKCDLKVSDLHKLQTAAPVSFPANIQQEDGMDEWRKGSHLFLKIFFVFFKQGGHFCGFAVKRLVSGSIALRQKPWQPA